MGDGGWGAASTHPASPIPLPEKFTIPSAILYSRWHTGHPTTPARTIRPDISPVESTRNSSRCGSGQRSISVTSMCSGLERDPSQLPHGDTHTAIHLLALDLDAEAVIAGRDVGDGEVLVVDGIRVIAWAVGLDERERRLLRLGFDEPVDAGLLDRLSLRIPHLPGDEPGARERFDPELGVGVEGRVADVRVDDLAGVSGRGRVDFQVQMVVRGAAGVADEGNNVPGFDTLVRLEVAAHGRAEAVRLVDVGLVGKRDGAAEKGVAGGSRCGESRRRYRNRRELGAPYFDIANLWVPWAACRPIVYTLNTESVDAETSTRWHVMLFPVSPTVVGSRDSPKMAHHDAAHRVNRHNILVPNPPHHRILRRRRSRRVRDHRPRLAVVSREFDPVRRRDVSRVPHGDDPVRRDVLPLGAQFAKLPVLPRLAAVARHTPPVPHRAVPDLAPGPEGERVHEVPGDGMHRGVV